MNNYINTKKELEAFLQILETVKNDPTADKRVRQKIRMIISVLKDLPGSEIAENPVFSKTLIPAWKEKLREPIAALENCYLKNGHTGSHRQRKQRFISEPGIINRLHTEEPADYLKKHLTGAGRDNSSPTESNPKDYPIRIRIAEDISISSLYNMFRKDKTLSEFEGTVSESPERP